MSDLISDIKNDVIVLFSEWLHKMLSFHAKSKNNDLNFASHRRYVMTRVTLLEFMDVFMIFVVLIMRRHLITGASTEKEATSSSMAQKLDSFSLRNWPKNTLFSNKKLENFPLLKINDRDLQDLQHHWPMSVITINSKTLFTLYLEPEYITKVQTKTTLQLCTKQGNICTHLKNKTLTNINS